MTLEALLKLLREGMLNDRTDRTSGTSDYLWTDETLVTYINEAQRRFAVKGLILRDGSSNVATKVDLVPGQANYPLHPSVLGVITAKNELSQGDLNRVGHASLGAYRAPTDTWVDPDHYFHLSPGGPVAYSTDDELSNAAGSGLTQMVLRVYPIPSVEMLGRSIRLRVVRKPLAPLRLDIPTAEPEIPEDHHIEMLDWAAYLALRVVDDDAGSPKRADEFRQMFEEHVKQARVIAMRKLFAPIGWGFGRGGFSWDS